LTRRPLRACARLVLVALVGALVAGCQVRTDIGIDVHADGSGTVTVAVGLDDDAVKAVGDLGATLRTEDLTKAGWTVSEPAKEADGYTYVRVSKPFANPAEADEVFGEISGPTGPFRDFHLTRARTFARTEVRFTGTVDFSGGLTSFTDSGLAQQLDGKPLGQDVPTIEQRVGGSLDKAFTFRVLVRLPGDVTSNATAQATNGAEWEPKLSDRAPSVLTATGRSWRVGTIVFTALGALAVLALVVLVVVRLVRRRRRARPA
jgi:hypothetical protein